MNWTFIFVSTLSASSVSKYLKYSYGFRLFAFAVSAILYAIALAWAPLMVSMIFQFFLPTQNGRIARSAAYADIRISCGTKSQELRHGKEELPVS